MSSRTSKSINGCSVKLHPFFVCVVLSVVVFGAAVGQGVNAIDGDPSYDKVRLDVTLHSGGIAARQEAITAAKEDGLRLWLETQMVDLDEITTEKFAAAFETYVVSTDVVDEKVVSSGRELTVAVYIDREQLRFDLASYLFPLRTTAPRAVVILGEEFAGGKGYTIRQSDVGASMLVSFFDGAGYVLKGASEIDALFSQDDLNRVLRDGSVAAGKLGRALNSDIVFLGEVRSEQIEDPTQRTLKVRATADIMAVLAQDGTLLERTGAEAVVSANHLESASRRAAEDAVYKVQQRLLVAASLGLINAREYERTRLVVRSENIRPASSIITKFLASTDPISKVELLHDSRNSLVYDIAYEGKLGALVRLLEDPGERGFALVPVQVVADEMVFDLATTE